MTPPSMKLSEFEEIDDLLWVALKINKAMISPPIQQSVSNQPVY